MKAQLRIRERLSRQGKAGYKDVELGDGPNAPRGEVQASVTRIVDDVQDCLTFVTDTMHNRAKFISNSQVECSHYKDGQWVVLDEAWLDNMFAEAKGAKVVESASKSSEVNMSQRADGYAKFADNPKNRQLRVLQDMLSDEAVEQKQKVSLVDRIVSTNDSRIANTVKEFAKSIQKQFEPA